MDIAVQVPKPITNPIVAYCTINKPVFFVFSNKSKKEPIIRHSIHASVIMKVNI